MTQQVYTGASDATPMDLADQAVDKSMQVIEELIFKTQELSELYVQGVQAQQAQMLRVPKSRNPTPHMRITLLVDGWIPWVHGCTSNR